MTEIGRAMGSPHRFGYRWHIVGDREDATDDISFDAHAGATLVTVVHSGWERLGAAGARRRERNHRGRGGLLPHNTQSRRWSR